MSFKMGSNTDCSFCKLTIPAGQEGGFTWDRKHGGAIHTLCMHKRRIARLGVNPENIDVSVTTPVTPTPVTTDAKSAALIDALRSMMNIPVITETDVERIARKILDKNKTIDIRVNDLPPVTVKRAHRDFPLLMKLASQRDLNGNHLNIYMHGAAGSGKSTAAKQVADCLNLPFNFLSLNPQTPESRVIGYMDAMGKSVTTMLKERYINGGVFCIDELDNSSANMQASLNSMIENGHGEFPDGRFKRHENFVLICGGNTIGLGGDMNFPDRRPMDGAFRDRFVFLHWDYDHDLTRAIVQDILGDATPDYMDWVNTETGTLKNRFPTAIVSPRAYIQGAVLKSAGLSKTQIKDMVLARGLK